MSTISALLDTSFFTIQSSPPPASQKFLVHMVMRWKTYLEDGTFALSVPPETPLGGTCNEGCEMAQFWTSPWPYWDMKIRAEKLWDWLSGSGMVIFKAGQSLSLSLSP
jgi:hypothetical protein